MGHPLIDEFCRVPGVGACQPHFFNRCQREFRDTIQPLLDEREQLLVENATLKEAIDAAQARLLAQDDRGEHRDGDGIRQVADTSHRHRTRKGREETPETVTR